MIPWIQVYSNLPKHKKTGKLVDALGLKNSFTSPSLLASGLLIGLWVWAAQNALDGDLSDCSAQTIADACGWKKKPDVLVNALTYSGFLDADMKLHDWEEYAVLMMESEDNRREKTKERVRRYRERKRVENGINVCQYCGEKATGFDHIIPRSKGGTDNDENLVPCCPRCNSAKQDRPLVDFLNRNLDTVDIASVMSCEKLTRFVAFDSVTKKFVTVTKSNVTHLPNHTIPNHSTTTDYNKEDSTSERYTLGGGGRGDEVIKAYCSKINATPSEICLAELEAFTEALGPEVCIRAMDIAIDAKKANWNYIRGILRNAKQRGVTCLADFEALDQKHQEEVSAKKYGKQPFASARLAPDAVSEVEKAALAKLIGDNG